MGPVTKADAPTFIPPMLATLVGAPFDDPDWLFEVKWDGFRVEAVVDGDSVRLWTRGEKDAAESYFGPFLQPPTWIDARQAIVDGEVIALVYEVFDLLHLDGRSLLDEPLEKSPRKVIRERPKA